MSIDIRRLTTSDRALARRVFLTMTEVFGDPADPLGDAYLATLLARSDFWAFAAADGDAVLGGITAHTLLMTRGESRGLFIYDLPVVPDRQRQSAGRRP